MKRCCGIRWPIILLFLMALGAAGAEPKRVLVIQSFGGGAPPFTIGATAFETALTEEMGKAIDLDEVSLDMARYAQPDLQEAFADFLSKRLAHWKPDLVVTIGSPAGRFVAKNRELLFPQTPILYSSMDRRILLSLDALKTNATHVGTSMDLAGFGNDMLQLAPDTTNLLIVLGASPLERYWTDAFRSGLAVFTNRVGLTFLNDLSFDQMQERLARLPPHSFIFMALLVRDAAGVTFDEDEALRRLHAVANAPINGIWQNQLGMGIVGGRLYQAETTGIESARVAVRILRGEPASSIPPQVVLPAQPQYDWRELRRWHIPESRLPAGSIIKFRAPTLWEQYRWHIIGVFVFCCLQTVLIVGLFVNRIRRREADTVGALIAELSSKFIHLPANEVDREIEDAQRRVCECLGLDISSLWQWVPGQTDTLIMTHLYRRLPGPATPERFDAKEYFPWALQQLKAGRTVALSTNNVPAEAARDLEVWRHFGLKTVLNLPMTVGAGVPIGLVAFNDTRADREWTALLVQRLQLVAQVFANALARKRADQALHESEERMTLAAEAAQFGVWGWSIDRDQIWGSERWQRLFGFAPGDAVSFEKVMQRIHPDDRGSVEREVRRALANGSDYIGEFRVVLPDGTRRWIISRGRGYRDPGGEPVRMLGTAVDVTERKQTEAELLQQRAELAHLTRVSTVGVLAGTLAHELNQPLSAILSNAQAGSRFLGGATPDLDEVRGALEDIAQDTKRAGEVIRQIRAFVKKDEQQFQPLDLNQVINEVVRLLHGDSHVRRIGIELKLAPGLPAAEGDNVQLQQVVLNLMLNAFDAMKDVREGERIVVLRTWQPDTDSLQFSITDRGTGISPERFATLFEPFQSTKREGLGLGLSISRSIISAHRGRLWAENNPGPGATFNFTLPVHETGRPPT